MVERVAQHLPDLRRYRPDRAAHAPDGPAPEGLDHRQPDAHRRRAAVGLGVVRDQGDLGRGAGRVHSPGGGVGPGGSVGSGGQGSGDHDVAVGSTGGTDGGGTDDRGKPPKPDDQMTTETDQTAESG